MRKNFRMEDGIYIPDDEGNYQLWDDGRFFGPRSSRARRLYQCGPNEYTTHSTVAKKTLYRRDGVNYVPDAKRGTVSITGNFPLFSASDGKTVHLMPNGYFLSVDPGKSFIELVKEEYRNEINRTDTLKRRKIYQERHSEMTMTFRCVTCSKQYETKNFMQCYCSVRCRNKRGKLVIEQNRQFNDYGDASTAYDAIDKNERWKDVPFQKEITAEIMDLQGSLIHADIFPIDRKLSADIILSRMKKDGVLRLVRTDPKTGLKVYAHTDYVDVPNVELVIRPSDDRTHQLIYCHGKFFRLYSSRETRDNVWRVFNMDGTVWGQFNMRKDAITWLKCYGGS